MHHLSRERPTSYADPTPSVKTNRIAEADSCPP